MGIKANAIECYDCGVIYLGEQECPEEPEEHGYGLVFVTDEPLGLPSDADSWHFGRKQYVYDADAS